MKKVYVKEEVCISCHLCEVYCQLQHAQVEILARLPGGVAVACKQEILMATAFHPELTGALRLHSYFC